MAVLTIRNIEDSVKERLRVRAATHGRSMEEDARVILRRAVAGVDGAALWALSRQQIGNADGVALELARRDDDRVGGGRERWDTSRA